MKSQRNRDQRHSSRARGIALRIAIAACVASSATAHAQARGSGLQVTPDLARILVSKDVGDERWAIARNDDGTVTGNVFPRDGAAPSFVWCEELEQSDDTTLVLACYVAGPCAASPCSTDAWSFFADVTLPASFFAPSLPAPTTTPTPSATPAPSVTSSPATPTPPTPDPSPTVTSSPGEGDIRCCVPDDDGPECEDRTPSECVQRGGTNLGPGSCDPDPCGR